MSKATAPAKTGNLRPRGKSLGMQIMEHWQLYVLLLIPIILTFVYKYIPMYGIQIAFRDY